MEVYERMKSERERLGWTQPGVAALTQVGKTTVINWEKGASSPTAIQLEALAKAGFDVMYVVTGQRGLPLSPTETLAPRVRALVDNYQAADEAGKRVIEGTADLAAHSHGKRAEDKKM
ncbi:MAG: helix-turn-helix transcriptional regulator [Burkholderiaceae bacterium]|nr:helix-turn-helix transcriptional regulator [Burkholderiaceae bacterium]